MFFLKIRNFFLNFEVDHIFHFFVLFFAHKLLQLDVVYDLIILVILVGTVQEFSSTKCWPSGEMDDVEAIFTGRVIVRENATFFDY